MKRDGVVSLSVHRNTLERRRTKNNVNALRSCVHAEQQQGDLAGFALVTWDREGRQQVYLHLPEGQPINRNTVTFEVAGRLARAIAEIDQDF